MNREMQKERTFEELLIRMSVGDDDAAAEIFEEYAPYLKMVVRRRLSSSLQAEFDSSDVIQSVWGDLLHGFRYGRWSFESPNQLRAFLVKATQNRLVDYVRRRSKDREVKTSLSDGLTVTKENDPVDQLNADEKWEIILSKCPAEHRVIVEMKRDGFSANEISDRTGLHPGSVRRILTSLFDRIEEG